MVDLWERKVLPLRGWQKLLPKQRKNMGGEGTAATKSIVGDQNSRGDHPVDFRNMSASVMHFL